MAERDSTAGGLVVGGFLTLVLSAFILLMAVLIGSDEPQLAWPFFVAGFIIGALGLGLFVWGIALLIHSALQARRR